MTDQDAIDRGFMRQALDFAEQGLGTTGTNPCVGAIVTQATPGGPVIVARGHTQPGGRPHGEADAFASASAEVAGGTLYVTLEPCAQRSIRAATPCLELTLRSGVRRVVSAMEDPNPNMSGLSHALLRAAGLAVTVGVLEDEARRSHKGYLTRLAKGRPMVTFKVARTADGYAGGVAGSRIAVSCEAAMAWVHLQRARHDAIMLAIGSVLADDPQLTVRLPGLENRSPIRVILDSHLRLPLDGKLVTTARQVPVWVIATEAAPVAHEIALVKAGCEVMRVGADASGHLDLAEALQLLGTRGITRVFSEGGPTVGEKLAQAGLADEVIVSTSPNALGEPGVIAVRPALAALLANADFYELTQAGLIGCDHFEHFTRTG